MASASSAPVAQPNEPAPEAQPTLAEVCTEFITSLDQLPEVRQRLQYFLIERAPESEQELRLTPERERAVREVLEGERRRLDLYWAAAISHVRSRNPDEAPPWARELVAREVWVLAPHLALTIRNHIIGDLRFRSDIPRDEIETLRRTSRDQAAVLAEDFDAAVERYLETKPLLAALADRTLQAQRQRYRELLIANLTQPVVAPLRRPISDEALKEMRDTLRELVPHLIEQATDRVEEDAQMRLKILRRSVSPRTMQVDLDAATPEMLRNVDSESDFHRRVRLLPNHARASLEAHRSSVDWFMQIAAMETLRHALTAGRRMDFFDPLQFPPSLPMPSGHSAMLAGIGVQLTYFDPRYQDLHDIDIDPRSGPAAPPLTEPYRPDTRLP